MAFEEILRSITLEAAADLSGDQYRFVTIDSSGQAVAASASGVRADGVLQNKPDAQGKAATVATQGISKVEAGGTVSAGDDVATDSSGKAVTAASGAEVIGVARTGGASTELISVLLAYGGTA